MCGLCCYIVAIGKPKKLKNIMKFKEKEYSEIYARVGRIAPAMPFAILNRVAKAAYDQHVDKTSVHCIYFQKRLAARRPRKARGVFLAPQFVKPTLVSLVPLNDLDTFYPLTVLEHQRFLY